MARPESNEPVNMFVWKEHKRHRVTSPGTYFPWCEYCEKERVDGISDAR